MVWRPSRSVSRYVGHQWRYCALGAVVVALAALVLPGAATSGSSRIASDGTITIGASVPLSGPLAGFGFFEKWGYQHAVNQVNTKGGITVDGVKKKVKLILLDDKTDPNVVASNVDRLITQYHVDALLGSCTSTLVLPGALAAERNGVPFVAPCSPVETFKSVRKWRWAWSIFFDESQFAASPFATLKRLGLPTNKRVAIIHANGPAETAIGAKAWPAMAKKYGYKVVYDQGMPLQSTQFDAAIARAKAANVDIFLVIFAPPQAIEIRKEMKAAGFAPKVVVMEEGGEPVQFAQALGRLANGVLVAGYWDPSFPYPGAKTLMKQFEAQTHQTSSQHIADTYTAAQVLLDAFARAGTTDKAKVNAAIGRTNKVYVVGKVRFDAGHAATIPIVETQWQNGKSVIVSPKGFATGKMIFPFPPNG